MDTPAPVTPADVISAVDLARRTFAEVPDADWDRPAGTLEWSCWETVEHMADDLFAYAAQIAPAQPPVDTHTPISWHKARPGGPGNAIFAERTASTAGLLQVLEVCGAFLAAIVAGAPDGRRAHHIFGVSDPEGFAAMGVVEVLVHGHDVAAGLGLEWSPPAALCRRALHRLFPEVAAGEADPWAALLWATGRGELPGHARRTQWRWDGRPAASRTIS